MLIVTALLSTFNFICLLSPVGSCLNSIFPSPTFGVKLVKDKVLGTEMNEVVLFQQFKNFDHGTNIKQGFYGNRVVAIDVLTKRYDERIETYGSQFRNLSPMENGALISTGEHPKGFLSRIGSTHTRYLATELLTTSLDTGNPSSFSTGSIASYSLHP